MTTLSDRQKSITEGRRPTFYAELKNKDYKKYVKVQAMGGMWHYENEFNQMQNRLAEIFYEIKDHPVLSFAQFYRFNMSDRYCTASSFTTMINKMAFDLQTKSPALKAFNNAKFIIDSYYDYVDHVRDSLPKRTNDANKS